MGRGKRIIDQETEQVICRAYSENTPLRIIATEHNISQTTIMAVIRRNNMPLRNKKSIIPDIEKAVISLYKKGEAIKTIMKLTGVKSAQTIYRILSDHDVDRRRNTQ